MSELELEKELRKLRPVQPSRELEERLAESLDGLSEGFAMAAAAPSPAGSSSIIGRWLDRLLWSGLGAAAAAVLMISLAPAPPETHVVSRLTETPAPVAASRLQPVMASEEDLGWRDEGVQFDPQGQPLLKFRRLAVERKAWADLENAGVIQTETPRQEVMWVPVVPR